MLVKIDSVEVDVLTSTLDIDDIVDERSTASFTVLDEAGTWETVKGEPVEIQDDDANVIFTGYVNKAKLTKYPGTGVRAWKITCFDQHYLADKRIVAGVWTNKTCKEIITDLITNYLSAEGVTAGSISDGETLTECIFNYVPIHHAIQSLAEKSNYWWQIDFDKTLDFQPRTSVTAPWTLTDNRILKNSFSIEQQAPQYRNTQYIRGGKDLTSELTENVYGDGKTRAFTVGFPIAQAPTIKLNGSTSKTVGIKGLDTDKDFYWSKGDPVITQSYGATLLTATDYINVVYYGEYNVIVKSVVPEEIDAVKDISGGTGIVEWVDDEPDNSTLQSSLDSANSKLARFGIRGQKIKFKTIEPGLAAGQYLTIDLPDMGLDGTKALIESVSISDADGLFLFYNVTCVTGPEEGAWSKFFDNLANKGKSFVVRDNIGEEEVLITLSEFTKIWHEAEDPNIWTELVPDTDLYPGASLYPVFDATHRVTHMAFLDGTDTEFFRKAITKQSGTTALLSICYVSPWEGNGTIAKVAWYGGDNATDTIGTGVKLDEQAYSKTKTDLEAIQVNKTDLIWFISAVAATATATAPVPTVTTT